MSLRRRIWRALGWAADRTLESARERWRGLVADSVDQVCRVLSQGEDGQGRRPRAGGATRVRALVVLAEMIREAWSSDASPRVVPRVSAAMAAGGRAAGPAPWGAVSLACCALDAGARSAQVARAVEALCTPRTRDAVAELHQRGALRHEYDVAYAVAMVEYHGEAVDQVEARIERAYASVGHACARVYPPS